MWVDSIISAVKDILLGQGLSAAQAQWVLKLMVAAACVISLGLGHVTVDRLSQWMLPSWVGDQS